MTYVPLLRPDEIVVGERFRRDLGDLHALAASIAAVGLLHPVVVTVRDDGRYLLVAGERRLLACESLGWERIPVRVVNLVDLLRAEHDENAVRLDFAPSEAVAIAKALRPVIEADAAEREAAGRPSSQVDKGRTDDKLASAVGMGRTTLRRAEAVVDAAAADPALAPLVEAMDDTGNVAGSLRAVESLPPDPAPGLVEAAAEAVRKPGIVQAMATAVRRIRETDPAAAEADRSERFAKAVLAHTNARVKLSPAAWAEGLDASDETVMRGHLVAMEQWIADWRRALDVRRPLRVVGG